MLPPWPDRNPASLATTPGCSGQLRRIVAVGLVRPAGRFGVSLDVLLVFVVYLRYLSRNQGDTAHAAA